MTPEQEQALALAAARRRRAEAEAQSAQPQESDGISRLRAAAQGFADTASFGLSDEAGALVGSLGGMLPGGHGKSYDELLPEIRGQQAADAEANPGTHLAGQIVGGVGQAVAAGPAILASPTLMGRSAGGAALGLAQGGTYGFGSGEGGFVNRGQNALVQGGIGAAVGAAAPVVAQGAGAAYRGVKDYIAKRAAAQQAGAMPEAVEQITRILQADDTLGPTGRANMQRAGADAMLADAGPNARQALDAAVQFGGRGTASTRQIIDERAGRAAQDMNAALDLHLGGPPVGVETARAGIRTAARPALNEAYDTAYSLPINYADETGQALESMVKNRVPKQAIDAANNLMRTEGAQSAQIMAHVDDAGNVVFETLPDVRQIDYITRGLRQMSESGEGAGALGGQTQLGSAYQNLARDLRSTLRQSVPEYGAALDTAADPISRSQAIKFGSTILRGGQTRDEVLQAVNGMSKAEKQAAAQGIRAQIDDQMANVERALTDPNMEAREAVKGLKTLSSRSAREKVAMVIGDDAAAQLFGDIDRAAMSFDLRAAIADNSKTFTRQSLDEGVNASLAPNAMQQLIGGKPIKAGQRLAETITGQNPAQVNAAKQEVYAQIADLLTRPAGQAQQAFSAMTDSAAQQALNQVRADQIRRIVGGAGVPLAYPSGALLTGRRQ